MKTKKFWSIMMMLMLVLGTAITFSSCGKDEEKEPESSIVGKWKCTYEERYGNGYAILTFKKDGSGIFFYEFNEDRKGVSSDTYSFYYIYDKEMCLLTLMRDGKSDRTILKWINKDTFHASDDMIEEIEVETIWKRQ